MPSTPVVFEHVARAHVPESKLSVPWWTFLPMVAGGLLVLRVARAQWFFQDEWDFLLRRSAGSLHDLFAPHNEHWSTLPILIYRALFSTLGIESYLPYLVVLTILSVVLGSLVALVVRRSGAPTSIACLAGTLIVVFGAGAANLMWAFQIAWVLSLVAFILALLVLQHSSSRKLDWIAALLLLASIMSSGLGPALAAGAGMGLLLAGEPRRALGVAVPPLLIYGAWLVAFRDEVLGAHDVDVVESLTLLPRYVTNGMARALEALFGFGLGVGPALLVVLLLSIFALSRNADWRPPLAAGATIVATVLVYSSAGLVRASLFGVPQAGTSRYVHVGGTLLLTGILVLAFSSKQLASPTPRPFVAVALLFLGLATADGIVTLREQVWNQTDMRVEQRDRVAAILEILSDPNHPDVIDQLQPVPFAAHIFVERIRELIRDGELTALDDVDVSDDVRLQMLRRMQFGWFAEDPEEEPLPWELNEFVRTSLVELDEACLTVQGASDDPQVRLLVRGRGALEVRSESGGAVEAFLEAGGSFRQEVAYSVGVESGGTVWLLVAATGQDPHHLRIDPPPLDRLTICGG